MEGGRCLSSFHHPTCASSAKERLRGFVKGRKRRTSSNNPGNTFLLRSFSEKPGSTRNRPFRNVAFSSRDLLENEAGSRKFNVEIAREEKYGWEGREARDSRVCGVLVINLDRMSEATAKQKDKHPSLVTTSRNHPSHAPFKSSPACAHLTPPIHFPVTNSRSTHSLTPCIESRHLNGGFPFPR